MRTIANHLVENHPHICLRLISKQIHWTLIKFLAELLDRDQLKSWETTKGIWWEDKDQKIPSKVLLVLEQVKEMYLYL